VRRRSGRSWLAAALAGCLLLGCERAAVRPSYPPDPLFLSKKPVPGKAESAQPALAYNEPAAPPLPPTALATAPHHRLVPLETGSTVTHQRPPLPGPAAGGVEKTASLDRSSPSAAN
jgi:hypothetical protein